MSDFLLELSQNPTAKKLIQSVGLPLPLPTPLARPKGPITEQLLADQTAIIGGEGDLSDALAHTLCVAGANPMVVGDKLAKAFAGPGEAYGRNPQKVAMDEVVEGVRADVLVFDATGFESPADLKQLHDFFQPRARHLAKCSRVIVLGRPADEAKSPTQAAARAAVEGFVRSFGKEIGGSGGTANLLYVDKGAEDRVEGPVRFFASKASAFVDLQPLRISKSVDLKKVPQVKGYTAPLTGKVALVTGAARGIGAATAKILAGEGAHVVILDRPADDGPASQVAREIGGSVLLADVSTAEAPMEIAKALKERHGGVDIVVHNAGITRDKMLRNMKPELWDMAVEINLNAPIRINDALIKEGVINDGGRIICLSSMVGLSGNAGQTNYSAGKRGVVGYVQALGKDLASRGITVNAIAPGFIETRMTAAIPVAIREVGRRLSALSQGGQPEDVGQAIAFFALPSTSGITSQALRVCGGAFIGA